MEIVIIVREMGPNPDSDQLLRIRYDGFIIDERQLADLGDDPETVADRLRPNLTEGMELRPALRAAVDALAGPERTLADTDLEVAVLSRTDDRRAFRRIVDGELSDLLG